MSEQVVLAIVGILATTVAALIWVIKYMFDRLMPIVESLKESVDENTTQTKANTTYLQERNGKDSRTWQETMQAIHALRDSIKE